MSKWLTVIPNCLLRFAIAIFIISLAYIMHILMNDGSADWDAMRKWSPEQSVVAHTIAEKDSQKLGNLTILVRGLPNESVSK